MNFRKPFHILILLCCLTCLFACRTTYKIREPETAATVIPLDSTLTIQEDSIALAIIAPYKASMDAEMNEVLAYSEQALTKDQPEGPLGSFIADVVLAMASEYIKAQGGQPVDFCLLNNGGLRSTLPKGAITTRNIFELMPFENKLVVLQISGTNAEKMFHFIAREGGMPVAGVRMGIKDEKAMNILVKAKAFDNTANYWVVTSDYLSEGGDNMSFFNAPIQKIELTQKVREAIIEYLRIMTTEGKTITAATDKRVYYEK